MRLCVLQTFVGVFSHCCVGPRQEWEVPRNNWRLQVQARVVWEFAGVREAQSAHNTADARVKSSYLFERPLDEVLDASIQHFNFADRVSDSGSQDLACMENVKSDRASSICPAAHKQGGREGADLQSMRMSRGVAHACRRGLPDG